MRNFTDVTGQKFNKLTAIEYKKRLGWMCECECGNITGPVCITHLRSGKVMSCGCFKKERRNSYLKKKNIYKFEEESGIGFDKNEKIELFLFDKDDYDLIKNFYWNIRGTGYIETYSYLCSDGIYRQTKIHRLIMANKLGLDILELGSIDHINRNKKDNRKCNLRIATNEENGRNQTISSRNNSGCIGVYPVGKKWCAKIENIHLGTFENKEDAIIARLKSEKEMFGEFSSQQNLFEKYGI